MAVLVDEEYLELGVRTLHRAFGLDAEQPPKAPATGA
jgi:hypothetical protein